MIGIRLMTLTVVVIAVIGIVPPSVPIDYQLVQKVVLDENIWEVYLGAKGEKNAAKPVIAKLKRESTAAGVTRTVEQKVLFFDDNLKTVDQRPYGGM